MNGDNKGLFFYTQKPFIDVDIMRRSPFIRPQAHIHSALLNTWYENYDKILFKSLGKLYLMIEHRC